MSEAGAPEATTGSTPAEIADSRPFRPILSSPEHGWDDVTLYLYRHSSFVVDAPAARDPRLNLQLAGRALVEGRCDGRFERRWADSGSIALTPAGLSVTRAVKGSLDVLLVYVASALMDGVVQEAYDRDPAGVSLVERMAVPDEVPNRLGRLLLAEAEAREPGARLAVDGLARALAVHLLRRHSSLAPGSPPDLPSSPSALAGWRLRRVVEQMHARLDEDLSLACLAAVSGLGPTQFGRAFRAATGEPPHRYLTRLRVERARELLERTTLSVAEVGRRCGFGQPAHFATMFRRFTGMSPRAWRRMRCA